MLVSWLLLSVHTNLLCTSLLINLYVQTTKVHKIWSWFMRLGLRIVIGLVIVIGFYDSWNDELVIIEDMMDWDRERRIVGWRKDQLVGERFVRSSRKLLDRKKQKTFHHAYIFLVIGKIGLFELKFKRNIPLSLNNDLN